MDDLIPQEIENIVAIGEKLVKDASTSDSVLGHDRIQELTSIAARGGNLIARLYGSESHYLEMLQSVLKTSNFSVMYSQYHSHVANMVGIFKAVQHDIENGMLINFGNLIRAEIFSDFLEMAEYLLKEGYKDASAVLLGAILENTLRKIADSNGIDTLNPKGNPLTIEPLNVSLAKKGVYGPLIQKQVTTWAHVRNDAAHGRHDKYDSDQTNQMLLFVQKFCSDFLE